MAQNTEIFAIFAAEAYFSLLTATIADLPTPRGSAEGAADAAAEGRQGRISPTAKIFSRRGDNQIPIATKILPNHHLIGVNVIFYV